MSSPSARVVPIDPLVPDPSVIAEAASILTRGGLVAFPTETVYGLGARGLHADEVARIFVAKGRPPGHPLILHVDSEAMASVIAGVWSPLASRFAKELWPGPLTLVVPRGSRVPSEVSGGLSTVGLRCPAHPVALALIRAVGEPLAAPSANAHTHVSPTTAAHVVRSLGDRVELILDAGPCTHGIESTVVALADDDNGGGVCVLRPGAISIERLRAIEPRVVYEKQHIMTSEGAARASPGMAAKHYAPRAARVLLVPRDGIAETIASRTSAPSKIALIVLAAAADREADTSRAAAAVAAATTTATTTTTFAPPGALVIELPNDPIAYARELFAALHAVDAAGAETVIIEQVPANPAWLAVADRLARAAG